MKSKLKGVVAGLAFFGLVSTASADIIHVTYSGSVLQGTDTLGFFGTPGASLAGDAYTTSYIFNTNIGLIQSDPFFNSDLGGIGYAQPSPSLGAILTINGISIGFAGITAAYLYGIDYGDLSRSYDLVSDASNRSVFNQMSDPSRSIPVSINAPFTYTVTSLNGGYGQGQALFNNMLIDLAPTTVTVFNSSVPSVPEPSTWAMMLIGFAGLGFAFRQSRRKLSFA